MHLTIAQLQTLKAAIAAETDPAFVTYRNNGQTTLMAAWFNQVASPSFIVWRTDVSRDDVTGDGFDWTQVDNLTTGQARIWDLIFQTETGRISFASAGKRAGISECWKGTAAKVAVATYVLSQGQRAATRAEKMFATGTGTVQSPGVMLVEGAMQDSDISAALSLP